MRFLGTCFRAHDPRWSFRPLSGDGAAVHGGRFNAKGTAALYLALTIEGAVKEANQGFAFKMKPYVLCSYEVDCNDIADLRTDAARAMDRVNYAEMSNDWLSHSATTRGERPSWRLARRLQGHGYVGILVPSFAPGALETEHNLVLWDWGPTRPHQVNVYDPSGRLPKNQLSWE